MNGITKIGLCPGRDRPDDENRCFPLFTSLSKDLRDVIWKEALPRPKVVFLEAGYMRSSSSIGFRPQTPAPASSFACREPFEVARNIYSWHAGVLGLCQKLGSALRTTHFSEL